MTAPATFQLDLADEACLLHPIKGSVEGPGSHGDRALGGLVYLPHSSVTMSGAVNKSSSGSTCFVLVVDNITINGTGSIFANNSQCGSAGLTEPYTRGTLVN